MSLTFQQMKGLELEIKPILEGLICTHFFAQGPRIFILGFQDRQLLLSLQKPFLRFHLVTSKHAKVEDPFADKVGQAIAEATLQEFALLNEDRILSLSFKKKKKTHRLIAEFFSKKSNLYLLDEQGQIKASLNPSQLNALYRLPAKPLPLSLSDEERSLTNAQVEKHYQKAEEAAEFLKQKNQIYSYLNKRYKALQKQLQESRHQLQQCQNWQQIQHEALLLQANLYRIAKGSASLTVSDWEQGGNSKSIVLDPLEEPVKQVERRFLQSKKLKRGINPLEERIAKLKAELESRQRLLDSLEAAHSAEELAAFHIPTKADKLKIQLIQSKPYHEFTTESGLKIWVGKSGKQNDHLTFHLARGLDYWFHVAGCPGAHVILRCMKGQDPDPESIQDAIQLALRYSKAKDRGESEVCYTQCKYVMKSGTNDFGKVQISKHKMVHARQDNERWHKLQQRKEEK